MNDPEIIASFEPGGRKYVLVLEFDELEDMVQARQRIVASMCGWTDEGERYDKVEVRTMTSGSVGSRPMAGGALVGTLVVSSAEDERRMELTRREIVLAEQKRRAPVGSMIVESWRPSDEHLDMLEKWAETAVAVYPAGEGWQPRAKTGRVREGYNVFALDHGREDLQLHGVHGGRVFADFIRVRFPGEGRYAQFGGNPYFVGLYRKPEAKRDWFPTIFGAPT